MESLKNKVAIVTGGASGMGKAISELYASEGAKVIIADLNVENGETVEKEIKNKGGDALFLKVNVANEGDINSMIDTAIEEFGTLDILVNNAGIMDNVEPVGNITNKNWDRIFDINTKSVMYAMRKALPIFLDKGTGVFINNISTGGLNGGHAGVAYTASKHAVVGMTKNTAFMYADSGIRCNGIAPGGVKTNIFSTMKNVDDLGASRQSLISNFAPSMGQPEDIANLALFLASDASSFINGTVITADGGMTSAF